MLLTTSRYGPRVCTTDVSYLQYLREKNTTLSGTGLMRIPLDCVVKIFLGAYVGVVLLMATISVPRWG